MCCLRVRQCTIVLHTIIRLNLRSCHATSDNLHSRLTNNETLSRKYMISVDIFACTKDIHYSQNDTKIILNDIKGLGGGYEESAI